MEWIVVLYSLGVLLTLLVYLKFYQHTIPLYEIVLTWFYQLPVMLIQHYKFKQSEKELIKRRAVAWSEQFWQASKTAELENWTKEDWQRWNNATDYNLTITVR